MSIVDLLILLRRRLKLLIAAVIVGMLATSVYAFVQPAKYTATASILVSEAPSGVASFLEGYQIPDNVRVDCKADTRTRTVTVVATSADSALALKAVNEAGISMVTDAREMYPQRTYKLYRAEEAVEASRNIPKFVVAGFIGGFAVAFVVIIALFLKNRPVLSLQTLERDLSIDCVCNLSTRPVRHKPREVYQALLRICGTEGNLTVCALGGSPRCASALASIQKSDKEKKLHYVLCDSDFLIDGLKTLREDEKVVLVVDSARSSMKEIDEVFSATKMQKARVDSFILC